MSPGPPAQGPDADDLQREVERLTAALHLAEQRRRTAEQTLAGVARTAAADTIALRERLTTLEEAAPGPRRRGVARRIRRTLLACGLVAGLVLITDGVLTVVWQEPLTALMQSRSQSALTDDLGGLQATFAAAPRVARETEALRVSRQARALLHGRKNGAALGRIEIPRIGLTSVFVESTTHDALTKGPGHYKGTVLPGLLGTVGLAGHRTTYGAPFRKVGHLPNGTRITVQMPYGRFVYRVTETRITTADDASSLQAQSSSRKLVLTACHPLYSAAKRIVVTARQTYAGPVAS